MLHWGQRKLMLAEIELLGGAPEDSIGFVQNCSIRLNKDVAPSGFSLNSTREAAAL